MAERNPANQPTPTGFAGRAEESPVATEGQATEVDRIVPKIQGKGGNWTEGIHQLLSSLNHCCSLRFINRLLKTFHKYHWLDDISSSNQVVAKSPHTKINFTGRNQEERTNRSELIRGVFAVSQRPFVLLQGQHALVTFEEEKGAHESTEMVQKWSGKDFKRFHFSHRTSPNTEVQTTVLSFVSSHKTQASQLLTYKHWDRIEFNTAQ